MIASIFFYASLLVTVVASFIALLAKQWLNRYLQHENRPVAERCADRQLKYDALEKWAFRSIINSLPAMLQVSVLLFICGVYQYLAPLNNAVAYATDILITLGMMFYSCFVIAGLSSPTCPYQTLESTALRSTWKKIRPVIFSAIPHSRRGLPQVQQGPHGHPSPIPLENVQVQRPELWLEPEELVIIQRMNANDARCVSWVLWKILDPKALDIAIKLAGII